MSVADRLALSIPGCASEPLLSDPDFVKDLEHSVLSEGAFSAEERRIVWKVPFRTILQVACMIDAGALGLEA